MKFFRVDEKLPEFDESGWAHNLLLWDGDTLYSGSCQKRSGKPVFIDWWVGGCDGDAQWWAPWPEKPTAAGIGAPVTQSANGAMVPCPTCGAACAIGGDDKDGTHYYIPVTPYESDGKEAQNTTVSTPTCECCGKPATKPQGGAK